MSGSPQIDKAGHDYWDKTWNDTSIPDAFDPHDASLENTFYQRLDAYFQTLIAGRQLKILEIGCAQSLWPAYFKKYHNIDIDGLDYSEIGCRKTRDMWDKLGLNGKIVCADMFAPPTEMIEQYDLVLSFGVVEHFEDTAGCLKACSSFSQPSGHVFTMIPNIAGIIGHIQKPVDRAVYDIHVPLTREALIRAHEKAGMSIDD
jgi:2-polyprenyl-3-methyl-5-hydroxy-6-metoxy-1,4-benzoquinol methylase